MGFNYGAFRNRGEDLPALRETILASMGVDNINYSKYDVSQIFEEVNRNLDKVQENYNKKYNFPPSKKSGDNF